ncbi:DNA repair protein SWI5 homolog isoform X2 [Aplysia californica]|uniref:DNA repair protein SWI5 homolog n=1 Tax=Aplysia californica TaxID=6500 RepID=A0ABM0JZ56_APLCA|nr:DNA repair protein SWI5 homolog isoform X2 [Aplysia californica]
MVREMKRSAAFKSTTSVKQFKSPLAKQFKSPLTKACSQREAPSSASEAKQQIEHLKKKLQETKEDITELESRGLRESELQTHIEKLHEYNEIKDIGQMLLGRIAVLEGVQTKDLYEKYGLNLND